MIARGLLDTGASVVISSRKADAVEAAVEELRPHGDVAGIATDVSREDECQRLASEAGGPLHMLVNNAGPTWGEVIEGGFRGQRNSRSEAVIVGTQEACGEGTVDGAGQG